MYKACPKCGKIHPSNHRCTKYKRVYQGGEERKERSTYAWTKKSLEIRNKANGLCEVCKDQGRYTYEDLEVHHIIKVKDNPSLLLDNNNLICLCVMHHKQADNNELDKEYLRRLVEIREKD